MVLLFPSPIMPCSVLVRRHWIERVGGFNPTLRTVEDYDLWLRLALAGCNVGWAHTAVAAYRYHGGQGTVDVLRDARAALNVVQEFFEHNELPIDASRRRDEVLAMIHLRGMVRGFEVGQVDEARKHGITAVELWPALLDQHGRAIATAIDGAADHPTVKDRVGYIRRVFDNLPQELADVRRWRPRAIAMGAAGAIFAGQASTPSTLRRLLATIILNDPSWLVNRGLISIVVRAHLRCWQERLRLLMPNNGLLSTIGRKPAGGTPRRSLNGTALTTLEAANISAVHLPS